MTSRTGCWTDMYVFEVLAVPDVRWIGRHREAALRVAATRYAGM